MPHSGSRSLRKGQWSKVAVVRPGIGSAFVEKDGDMGSKSPGRLRMPSELRQPMTSPPPEGPHHHYGNRGLAGATPVRATAGQGGHKAARRVGRLVVQTQMARLPSLNLSTHVGA